MNNNLEKTVTDAYQKALLAASEIGSVEDSIVALSQLMASTEARSPAYHEAHGALAESLMKGFRDWLKTHPPGSPGNPASEVEPDHAFYLYQDKIEALPGVATSSVIQVFSNLRYRFSKEIKTALRSKKSSVNRNKKDLVAARFPEYPQLLKQIAEAKKEWSIDDKRIRGTYAFRMMGGLARMGTTASTRYHSLVKDAQRMERAVLGTELTKSTKVR